MSDNLPNLEQTVQALLDLRRDLLQLESDYNSRLGELPEAARPSACNVLHYVGLRRHDLQPLQEQLARLGASSLGRCEPAVMISLLRVIELLCRVAGETANGIHNKDFGTQRVRRNDCHRLGALRASAFQILSSIGPDLADKTRLKLPADAFAHQATGGRLISTMKGALARSKARISAGTPCLNSNSRSVE
ncbi:MAG: hypothetical protein KDA62_19905 [Planctomycetales bacterium]|nr:hypothetical protein [Planctomycetales bacterium]